VKIVVDLVIPKSQHSETAAFKTIVAHPIASRVVIEIMLTAINLNDEAMSHAHEVDNRAAARRLATKMKSTLAPGAKMHPELDLLRRQRLAQTAGNFVSHDRTPPDRSLRSRPPSPFGGGITLPYPVFARISSSRIPRCSAVTCGLTPNQCVKPTTAW
jgi:hypothetical protein